VSAAPKTGTTLTATTNAQGCALFRSINTGTYTISLNKIGYLGKAGAQLVQTSATVNPNYVNVVSMTYDLAVTHRIAVKTLKPGEAFTAASTGVDSKAVHVADAAADASVLRTFNPVAPATTATAFDSPKLFPFDKSPYLYFTGDCAYLSPTKVNAANATYFTALNTKAAVQGDPTAFQPQPATVFQPAVNVRLLKDANGTAMTTTSTKIKVYAKLIKPAAASTDTCVSDYARYELTLKDWPSATYGAVPNLATDTENFVSQKSTGTEFDAGLPFGSYTLCFLDTNYSKSYTYATAYDNTSPGGRPNTLELSPAKSAWTGTTC
jgi:hypothetical protein